MARGMCRGESNNSGLVPVHPPVEVEPVQELTIVLPPALTGPQDPEDPGLAVEEGVGEGEGGE